MTENKSHHYRVRPATQDDLSWTISQLKTFAHQVSKKHLLFPKDENYVAHYISQIIAEQVLIIAELNGEPVGLIGGFYGPHFFNPDLNILTELFWWVMPEHRGTPAAQLLLESFVEKGRATADQVVFALGTATPVKGDKITALGFEPVEQMYLMEV